MCQEKKLHKEFDQLPKGVFLSALGAMVDDLVRARHSSVHGACSHLQARPAERMSAGSRHYLKRIEIGKKL